MSGPRNTIRTFALVCVAVTSLFVMGMSIWSQWLLGIVDYCGKIIGSSVYNEGRPDFAINGCVSVMTVQIAALANNSLIFGGVIALCLLALMVIVVAGGKLSFSGPGGFGGAVSKNDDPPPSTPAEGARQAAAAGAAEAEHIADQTEGQE